MKNPRIKVIIPAFNEEDSIALVIKDIPEVVDEVIVVSNNSTDKTEENARKAGAKVLTETRKGYGYACLKGMEYVAHQAEKPDIIVFLDGDYSDYPEQLTKIIQPILQEDIDFVIGARVDRLREEGSMTFPQIFGNWLATRLMRLFFGAKSTDLGPFRAIKYEKLLALNMEDKTYGWTVEMQLKAIKQKLSYVEVPVNYRNRIGVSKVSGTLKGAVMAGVKILGWIFKYSFK
ncbi:MULTISPECIES: glycosyltransferase family 2 protein [Mesonia]|uniref:Glycosyltransferase n=1 Tax=Mesonia oceanica TaxID=2687242 RepID=A0AC61Y7X6_9FLAO|nr:MULTISPECIES: glycosyltransferase family 2 protein [Mesonia]MBJ97044.1 UDP-glucose--dolichyl-phosphate glucosyltransferase [Flavobacteriaceae bacterium]MAN29478.1 UDP-glucose--dolichyl-phosphate glucosyltransferase [Mesonia sp.]MAQ39457.1 UDP-glucose--dolichyl-phosphate glucosyltransferase [Mesonia sp.]MAQ42132.1 UDP-glucose--dolichyl-phosphate glucosyltransferase [Mesonia sp.]VVV00604.1 putative glycosyltransferase [Mesonia oceanica]|tara:strand:- start:67770 stop:68465 length:696 start_codon:yes stop_codon:yes gene_type:complete